MKRKRSFTLLEIMIVIFLIGLIGSVIGFNMKGSLEEGKAFKTKHAMQQIEDVLTLQIAEGASKVEEVEANYITCLKNSNLIKSAATLSKDGWNQPFIVTVDKHQRVHAYSEKYIAYLKKNNKTDPAAEENAEDENDI